ncbi:MAG TPA: hypothetical protein DIW47_14325 [Bacteroidetes bacterium]|nr:hypothetical protein [Bacteroidota bacterium]
MGDTYLYAVLPTQSVSLHVPELWVGFLLSINRFIRIVANRWILPFFNRFGFYRLTLVASGTAVISTLLYGVSAHLVLWIFARLLWAFSYAILRLSSLSYSLETRQKGLSLGLSKGIQEIGPLLALLLGPVLGSYGSPHTTFLWLGGLSVLSLIFASRLEQRTHKFSTQAPVFSFVPGSFNFLVFLSAFFIEGLLVVVLGRLFQSESTAPLELLGLVAFYLAFRRVSLFAISPAAGFLADRIGLNTVFFLAMSLSIVSLLSIGLGFYTPGIIGCFLANSVSSALGPGTLGGDAETRLHALAANLSWRDLGAALGALAGGFLLGFNSIQPFFLIATFVLALALLFYYRSINHPVYKYGSN